MPLAWQTLTVAMQLPQQPLHQKEIQQEETQKQVNILQKIYQKRIYPKSQLWLRRWQRQNILSLVNVLYRPKRYDSYQYLYQIFDEIDGYCQNYAKIRSYYVVQLYQLTSRKTHQKRVWVYDWAVNVAVL